MMQSPVEIGTMLAGKYRIERVIGQGGMGIVVAAMHDELDQRVAIKFLSSDGAKGVEWIARFAREAKAAAKIKNEHAVKVFDVGRLEGGVPYMVMEYLEGKNLDEIIEERHTFTVEETADYILQTCEALAEAHMVGIVHRDLKPANLFLTHRSDGTPCIKILDFGISKVDESRSGVLGPVTHTTSLVGSPLYMSPERLRGAKDVDRRADIWSLGVIIQEMLTGQPTFLADTIPDIHALVLTTAPPPLRRGCPSAPPELEALVLKCLQKSPDARFQNVQEFATALGAIAPGSQGSVERIARITVGGSGPRARPSGIDFGNASTSGSFPPAMTPDPKLAITVAVDRDDDGEPPLSGRPVPASRESLPTVSATGTLGDALKKSGGRFALAFALVLVVAVGGTMFALRSHPQSRRPSPLSSPTTLSAPFEPKATQLEALAVTVAPSVRADTPRADTDDAREVAASPSGSGSKSRRHMRDAKAHADPSTSALPPPTATATASPPDSGLEIDYGGRN
jgi:serine/threonine-protein kinase